MRRTRFAGRGSLLALLLALAAGLAGGCRSAPFPRYRPLSAEEEGAEARDDAGPAAGGAPPALDREGGGDDSQDPRSAEAAAASWSRAAGAGAGLAPLPRAATAVRVVQRVTLEVAGRESTHSVVGAVFEGGSAFWQGFGDWGGGNFALRCGGGLRRSYDVPGSAAGAALERILLDDEPAVLAPPPESRFIPVVLDSGETALAARDGEREMLVRRGASPAGLLVELGRSGRWLSTIRIEGWFRDGAGRREYPRRIIVEGRDRGYRAWIDVISREPEPRSERALEEEFSRRFESR